MRNCPPDYIVDFLSDAAPEQRVVERLREVGVVVLRNTADPAVLDSLFQKTKAVLDTPALLGSVGYYMKDCHKKMCEGFTIGGEALTVLLNEKIIDICENYLGEKVLLQEMLVKNDLGDNEVYFPMHAHAGAYRVEKTPGPFSVGIMLYTHDTETGAFCYAPKSHLLDVSHGTEIENYPPETQREINESMCRIVGKQGDIVLFDHRGFHGPEQPVTVPRTVFLGGFHLATAHGDKVKTPTAVYVHELANLSDKQLRVLGIRSKGTIIPREKFHYFSFQIENPRTFKLLRGVADMSFSATRAKWKIKKRVKDVLANSFNVSFAPKVKHQEKE